MPSLLRDARYTTALVGKWNLGYLPHFVPRMSGYQHFYGFHSGGAGYFAHCDSPRHAEIPTFTRSRNARLSWVGANASPLDTAIHQSASSTRLRARSHRSCRRRAGDEAAPFATAKEATRIALLALEGPHLKLRKTDSRFFVLNIGLCIFASGRLSNTY